MKLKQAILGLSVASALLAMSGNAAASAFALLEQGGTGNAFAGGAAGAEDASIIFFNPAGMSRLKGTQMTLGLSAIQPSAKFSDTGSTGASLQTAGGNGGDAGSLAFVPNVYMVTEFDPALHFGLGIFAPFGLQTEYDPTWIGRFQAIKSKIQTVNLNPSVSYDGERQRQPRSWPQLPAHQRRADQRGELQRGSLRRWRRLTGCGNWPCRTRKASAPSPAAIRPGATTSVHCSTSRRTRASVSPIVRR